MKSPCVQICILHPGTGFCVGCHRTGEEIANWIAMTEAEREAVMAVLPSRVGAHRSRDARPSRRRSEQGRPT